MQKNDEFEIEITDMGNDGEGIGRYRNMTFFIKGAIVGDIIHAGVTKMKRTYGYARVISILQESPYRVKPVCAVAGRCGGCQLQSMDYDKQLEYKESKVRECLIRLGGIDTARVVENEKICRCISDRQLYKGDKAEFAIDSNTGKSNLINDNNSYTVQEVKDIKETTCESEFEYKAQNMLSDLRKDSVIFNRIAGMEKPSGYRNKAQFPVGRDKNGHVVMGFYAGHTHSIINIDSCLIQHEMNEPILKAVREYVDSENISVYDEVSNRGLLRHVLTRIGFSTHEIMVCLIINGRKLPHSDRLVRLLNREVEKKNLLNAGGEKDMVRYSLYSVSYCINTENTNVIMGEETVTVYGQSYITDYIGDVRYRISPLSFYQVNPVQTRKLYSTVLEYAGLTGKEIVWDIYCGIGTISLFLARKAKKVYGVEIVPQAIEDARKNAEMNGIDNAEFFVGAAEEVLPQKYIENPEMRADVIVADPPRKGCDEALLDTVVRLSPEKIVYVSCDPATLARDIRYLEGKGYGARMVQPVDMFPMSVHVETVVKLQKVK